MNVGRLVLRGTVGPLFIGHGGQKLFGWFDGHGLDGTGGFFESIGLRPGRRHATAAGAAELAGGALLTLGAFTPLAASLIAGTMTTAIRKVHAPNGPWVTNGGYEYNLTLIAAMAAITETGPGSPSVDAVRFPRLKGPALALLAVGAGVAGSYLVTEVFGDSEPAPQVTDVPGDPAVADDDSAPRFEREAAPAPSPAAVTPPPAS